MGYSIIEASSFLDYFVSNPEGYGQTKVGEIVDGKAQSDSRLVYQTPTAPVLMRHFAGEESIGLSPVLPNGNCRWCAIDIDDYNYSLDDIINAIWDFDLPLLPCWSKSHKLHIYMFFTDEVPCEEAIEILQFYTRAFACKKKTEIFPKQKNVSERNKFYSWINIPYFDANNEGNWRKAVGKKGTLLSLDEALERMKSIRMTAKEHRERITEIPCYDAPPCILSGVLLRDIGPGQRNNWLFSVGVYFRLKDEHCDLDSLLTEINNSLQSPIDQRELQNTILSGFQRKSYFYMCEALDRCDKTTCRQTSFGIESKDSTGLSYGTLTQIATDPPYYEWEISGQLLRFQSEEEILGQNKFRALCLRKLHIVPRMVKNDRWTAILNRACSNIQIKEVNDVLGDFTEGSSFMQLTYNYFNTTRKADNPTQLQLGRIWEDKDTNEYVFTAKSIVDFLKTKNGLTVKPVEIRMRLEDMGAYKAGSVWRIKKDVIPEDDSKNIKIDFNKPTSEEEDDTLF